MLKDVSDNIWEDDDTPPLLLSMPLVRNRVCVLEVN